MATTIWDGSESGVWDLAGNWDTAAVPGTGDVAVIPADATVNIAGASGDEAAIDGLVVEPGCSITIGTKAQPLELTFASETNATVDLAGTGTTFLKLTEAKAIRITAAAVSPGTGQFGLNLTGVSTTNENPIDIVCPADSHSIGIAANAGEIMEAQYISVSGGTVTIGNIAQGEACVEEKDGSTAPDMTIQGGTVNSYVNVGAVVLSGGTLTQHRGTITSLTASGGTYNDNSTGTVSTILASGSTVLDWRGGLEGKTVTACDIGTGVSVHDPSGIVTWTAGIDLIRCGVDDVTLNLGDHIRITRGSVA
jgi:hypothetical protein